MRDSDTQLLDDIVCDVFSFGLSGTLNFNFYEECATILPPIREVFKRCVYLLPREHVGKAWMSRHVVEYERTRRFRSYSLDQTFVDDGRYRVCRHPLTLKRYAVDTLHIEFCTFIQQTAVYEAIFRCTRR